MNPQDPIRGLDIRLEHARGRVMRLIDQATADCILRNARIDAYNLGYRDFIAGERALPAMFADELGLRTFWRLGNDDSAYCQHLSNIDNALDSTTQTAGRCKRG